LTQNGRLEKRTNAGAVGLSAKCQERTHALQHDQRKRKTALSVSPKSDQEFSASVWMRSAKGSSIGGRVSREGNPDGPFYGEVLVFTGSLCIPRSEAADFAAKVGCRVDSGVTKRTTLLVVGDEDVERLAGHDKSSKHRKAEELIQSGQPIRIIQESDFSELVDLSG
jgi:NAD-dependent DNA ligase